MTLKWTLIVLLLCAPAYAAPHSIQERVAQRLKHVEGHNFGPRAAIRVGQVNCIRYNRDETGCYVNFSLKSAITYGKWFPMTQKVRVFHGRISFPVASHYRYGPDRFYTTRSAPTH